MDQQPHSNEEGDSRGVERRSRGSCLVLLDIKSIHFAETTARPTNAERYLQARQEYDKFQERAQTHRGPPPLVHDFHADLQTITPVIAPLQILERYVFEKISIRGRALAAAVDLVGAIDGLEKSISYRNDLIAEIHKESPVDPRLLAERYFGLRNANGGADERFRASVDAIYAQTDDCIFFSRILADDLLTYGNQLRRKNAWKYRLRLPKMKGADWSIVERQGLLPPNEAYASWLAGFRPEPTGWRRLLSRARRS